jgi:MFS family permease
MTNTNDNNNEESTERSEKWKRLMAISAAVFIGGLFVLAIVIPNPTPFQYWVFRVILALAGAGIGAALPGFITVKLPLLAKGLLHAGGALAMFAIIYLVNPPRLAPPITQVLQSLYQFTR